MIHTHAENDLHSTYMQITVSNMRKCFFLFLKNDFDVKVAFDATTGASPLQSPAYEITRSVVIKQTRILLLIPSLNNVKKTCTFGNGLNLYLLFH